ncbi:MAG TPA: hypothetical protein PLN41_07200 [Methanothrix sp.]|jgi:hypothetical protein|nr:hypothetical protein [Methanothrix sp.]HOI69513.1 hypothetical protein [Methanothrix sp.]
MIREGDGEILAEPSGRMSQMDLSEQEDRGLPGGDRPRGGHPSPRAALRPFPKERILNEQVPTLKE